MVFPFSSRGELLADVRKIAVLRANAIGDFIFALPAMAALRRAYPEAELVLVGRDWHRDFLNGRPGPWDRVVAVPYEEDLRGWEAPHAEEGERERFFEQMRAERFDLAVQLYGGGKYSNPYLLRFGARVTAGMKSEDAAPLDRWIPYIYFQSEVIRYLEVAALVGAEPVMLEPEFELIPEDYEEARPFLDSGDRPLVILQPGAGDPRRRWPVERFALLGDLLVENGARVLVSGADNDLPLVEGVRMAMRSPAQSIYNELSLGGLGALFQQAAVVIGNDTGPIHIAAAVGARTVPIFWGINLINSGPFTRHRHRPALSWQVICPACGANTLETPCTHPVSFVATVSVHTVYENALALIEQAQTDWSSSGRGPS